MKDGAQKIATIALNHTVALFTPDTETLTRAASAGAKSLVHFSAQGENGGLSPQD